MAGSKGSKYYDVFLDYNIQLNHRQKGELMNETHFALLCCISDKCSLKEAAAHLGFSYRKAWGIMEKLEKELGFQLLERKRGGTAGGHTVLTPDGEKLVNAYQGLRKEFDQAIHDMTKKFFHELNEPSSGQKSEP